MKKYAGIAVFIICMAVNAQSDTISTEELGAFGVTLYAETEQIKLDEAFTLEGIPYDSGELRGKYVLINFWATWCPFCRQEKPSIQQLYSEHTNMRFTVLTISTGEQADTVRGYMLENMFDFPVVLDPKNKLKDVYAPRIPTSYIIDPEGNIIARINGNKEWGSELAKKVLRYLVSDMDE